ncbi:MAG: SdiA-regulated domain-containing protein [Polyangiaceae bacterium]|jgi:uncharacterized protein YjiK|nr:SdiA-regulated domain-containing protein [Polyangiaceae bacterium]MBK8942884.1 SdiA-regulated domain-containing protein [Polyangiaceae bacterium]
MRLVADHRLSVDLDETSDVVTLPSGAFLVVSDTDARAAIVTPDGTTFVELEGLRAGESGLEAVTFDAARGLIVSYDEERREVLSHHYGGEHAAVAPLEGRRELRFGKRKNKGVEGLAMFGDKLLCANEDKPRGLYVVEPSADEGVEVELDPAATDACDDFSGLAHDPRRGTYLVVSDESARLVELSVEASASGTSARCRGVFDLVDEQGAPLERVEGVAVDLDGAWWVLLENEHVLVRLRGE